MRTRHAGYLAIGLVVIYLAVALLAAACPAEPSGELHGHRHAGASDHGTMAHTLLCAWSCQASTTLEFSHAGPVSSPILVVVGILASAHTVIFSSVPTRISARAPPSASSRLF